MTAVMTKREADRLDFAIDFRRWLDEGDRIVDATATIAGGSATVDQAEFSETEVRVWVSGGMRGETSTVTATITTDGGRLRETCFRLRIEGCD